MYVMRRGLGFRETFSETPADDRDVQEGGTYQPPTGANPTQVFIPAKPGANITQWLNDHALGLAIGAGIFAVFMLMLPPGGRR